MQKKYIKVLVLVLLVSSPMISLAAISRSSFSKKVENLSSRPVKNLPVPIPFGVSVDDIDDTWGAARSQGREHEGTDIFAPRGMLVASPTKAVVYRIGTSGNGGLHVWTINPGNERFYYAHLDAVYPGLEVGDVLKAGDAIGFVGDSGNAKGTSPHLHWGIYDENWVAINPYPRINRNFNKKEQERASGDFIDYFLNLLRELQRKQK